MKTEERYTVFFYIIYSTKKLAPKLKISSNPTEGEQIKIQKKDPTEGEIKIQKWSPRLSTLFHWSC